MIHNQYSSPLFDQTKDLIWVIDQNFYLVYANKAYLNLMKAVTGKEKKLNESIFEEGFGDGYIEKWKAYFERGLNGEQFEIEEHFLNPSTNQIEYSQITFNPIIDENQVIVNIACQSRDITSLLKSNTEAEKLLDASLDVICSIDEHGIFTKVSAACKELWGYEKDELIGKAYISFVIEEDIEKTNLVAADIIAGIAFTTFENRYKRKDGGIAYNLWSAKWDPKTQIMFCVARDGREKIKKEELLIESENRFKALVQEGSDMISIIDAAGNYMYTSPTTTEILGITPEDFNGNSVFDFIHPDDIERAATYMQRITTESKVIVEPFRLRDGNNEWRWIETVLTNMLDNPAVGGIVANSRDITETVNILKDKEANEQFNKTIIESSPDCLKILDKEGHLLYMNFNGLCQMEIDDFSRFKHKKWELLWGTENEALIKESVNKALMGDTVSFTAFCSTAKGTPKWWDVTVSPVSIPGEPIQQIISVSRDITAKKAEEQRLKLLESVITNANDSVMITEAEPLDEPGPKIIYVNEAFTNITGYTAEEVIGKTPRILQGPNSDKAELAKLSKAIRNWEPCEITTINYKKNGEEFWVNLSISPVADAAGLYTHFIAIERDVTENKKLELSKELTSKISALFNIEPDLFGALCKLCKEVAAIGQFSFCEIWLTDIQQSVLELKAVHKYDDAANTFYQNSNLDRAFEKGQGMPGKVWENNQSLIWEFKGQNQEFFLRSKAAEMAGIKTIVGFPLLYHDEFIGIIQFGTQSIKRNVEWIINVLEQLGKFIGGEIARKKTEIELTKIFEFAPDIIITVGLDGYIRSVNPYTCKLLGYTEKELTSKPFTHFIHPADAQISEAELDKLVSGTPIHNFRNRNFTKTGEIKTISWNCSPSLEDGLIFCIGKDITEEVKIGRLLNESNQLSRIGSWEVNLISNSLFWSDITHEIHETPENFKPQLSEAIHFYREDFRELATEAVNACIETGTPFDFEAIIVTSKNNEVWIRAMGRAERVDGKSVRLFGSFQDINQKKLAELRLKSLSNNIPGTIFQYQLFPDGTDKLLHLSKGADKLWGIDAESGMKNNALIWDQIISGGDMEKVQSSIGKSMNSLENWHVHFRSKLPNGKIKWLEGLGTPKRLPDGSTIWDSIILDITDLKETEQLLESASRLARVGSWELVLQNNEEFKMFWSSMTKSILEIDVSYELTLANSINLYKEPSRTLIAAAVHNAIETGEAFDLELELITGKGNDLWIRCIGDAQHENGKVTRIYGSFQDINTRKLAELNQLKLNEEKNNILESIGDAFFTVDKNWVVSYWNYSAELILAKKKEDIVGKVLWDEYADAINTDFYTKYHYAVESMETQRFEAFYETRNQWVEVTAYPSEDGLSVYFKDITQRKKANEEVAKSEEKRKLIMNGALDAIITIDTNETITFWNPQAEVIFGWTAQEVMGKPLSEIIIPEPFRKYHVEGLKNYLQTGEGKALNVLLELSAIRRNSEEFPIELTVLPIKQGGEEFFCAFIRDITQRKKSERELIENENYLRTILDNEPECVKILNSKGELLSMNPAGLAMIEADNEQQVLGHRMTDLVNKEYHLGFNQLSKEVFKGNSGSFEFEITGLKGGCRWLETHAVPLKDTTGKIVNLLGVTRDITQRKKSESELLNAFNEKTNILERITEAFVSLDTNWCYTYMNKQAGEIFNCDPEKIIGKHIWTEFPEGFNQPFHLAYEKAMATQEYTYIEEHYEPYDSWFENHIYPSPVGISIFFRDITERKRSEKKLKMANERFEKVTEATKDVIWDWDIENGTFFRSNAIDNFFGVGTSKILEKKDFWKDNFHKEDISKIKSSLQKALEDPDCKRWEQEYRIINNNNETFFVIDRGLILRNKNGKAIRMVGAMTDISEIKHHEVELLAINQKLNIQTKELQRSNEELEQFAFITSHDLQEPLRMISSFMDQLKRKYADRLDEKGLQYIHFATDGAKRMKQIILDLLLYSRANKTTEQNELINLDEIVYEYTQLRRKVIAEKKAIITYHGLPSIETYRAPVTQIFHCLLDNALKYVDENKPPSIEIDAIEKENVWQFAIKDNGIGIDQRFFDKIFIIFQRLQNRKENDGTGIGLAIAKRSIEFLGGEIWVESEIDKGSTFYFTIFKIK